MLTPKTAWADGTRQLVFEPLELLEKLAALIPRPRVVGGRDHLDRRPSQTAYATGR